MLVTTTWKYWTIQRPHGTSYSQGHVVTMTRDSRDMATATGRAEGKMVESRKMRFVNALFYETHSENKLAFLSHLVGVNEYEVDALDIYEHRLWEWK